MEHSFIDTVKEEDIRITQKSHRVTIVGVGSVGMASAYAVLSKGTVGELVLCDVARDKLHGEVMDLQHAGSFLPGRVVAAGEDYAETKDSNVIIITAGARQNPGESRLSLIGRNLAIFKSIIPPLVKLSPDAIIMVVSNPVDILTYIAWKLSGFPRNRVFGSGTFLDSSRFRSLVASRLKVSPSSVHGWIVGEHGDSSVAVWSGVNVAGVPLNETYKDIDFSDVHEKVIRAAYEVIELKGYTNWAIGAAVASLVSIILRDERRVVPISTLVTGVHGVEEDVCLSVPCVLGSRGVLKILRQEFSEEETKKFNDSAHSIWDVQKELDFGDKN